MLGSAGETFQKLILSHEPIAEYFTSTQVDDVCVVSVSSQVAHVELLEFLKFIYNGKPKLSPTNEFIQLAKICNIDYNGNDYI